MAPSQAFGVIREAIQNRRQVIATYNGHRREMCPHVLGWKNGREQALFYQFGGTSSSAGHMGSGDINNWRCLPLDGLSDIDVRDGEWHSFSPHTQPQTCVDDIAITVADWPA